MLIYPSWLSHGFAGVMLLVAALCTGRLAWVAAEVGVTTDTDVDGAHIAMGIAMAGMLEASLRFLPTGVWEVVFAAMTVWFLTRSARVIRRFGWHTARRFDSSHHLTHLAMAAAMLYMFAQQPSPIHASARVSGSLMSGMAAAGSGLNGTGLPLLLAVVLLAAAAWYADGLIHLTRWRPDDATGGEAASTSERADDRRFLAPRVQAAAHIVMCVVMSYMLVLMR
jgi:hypothetical protein